jgi:hypothetical protein
MVREAQKAGLDFDDEKLEALHCCLEEADTAALQNRPIVPTIEVSSALHMLLSGRALISHLPRADQSWLS